MMRFFGVMAFLFWTYTVVPAQPYDISLGLFTGASSTYTWHEGIFNDARYKSKYGVKFAPITLNVAIDYQTWGLALTPGIINIGQHHHIINSVGGHEGTRTSNLRYATLPLAIKAHVIDLAFFRVSLAAGGGFGFLLDGREGITHNYAKYRFPPESYPFLPPGYVVEYDGVLAPATTDLQIVGKDDFKRFQAFGSAGFRSDWNVTDSWRVSLDVRINYTLFESRTDAYLARTAAYETIYDVPGKRRDIFATVNLGLSRYLEIDEKKMSPGKSSRKFTPQRNPNFEKRRKKNRKGR